MKAMKKETVKSIKMEIKRMKRTRKKKRAKKKRSFR